MDLCKCYGCHLCASGLREFVPDIGLHVKMLIMIWNLMKTLSVWDRYLKASICWERTMDELMARLPEKEVR